MDDKKPFPYYLLLALLFLEGITGLAGGVIFLIDPNGNIMQLNANSLAKTPFNNFIIPGILLMVFIGIYPLIAASGLIYRPKWKLAEKSNIYRDEMFWGWTHTIYAAITLLVFIAIETIMIGYNWLQLFYTFLGILVLIVALLPAVKNLFIIRNN